MLSITRRCTVASKFRDRQAAKLGRGVPKSITQRTRSGGETKFSSSSAMNPSSKSTRHRKDRVVRYTAHWSKFSAGRIPRSTGQTMVDRSRSLRLERTETTSAAAGPIPGTAASTASGAVFRSTRPRATPDPNENASKISTQSGTGTSKDCNTRTRSPTSWGICPFADKSERTSEATWPNLSATRAAISLFQSPPNGRRCRPSI